MAKTHEIRIIVVVERKAVAAVEPAQLRMPALAAWSQPNHAGILLLWFLFASLYISHFVFFRLTQEERLRPDNAVSHRLIRDGPVRCAVEHAA